MCRINRVFSWTLLLVTALFLGGCRLIFIVPLGGQIVDADGEVCAEDRSCEIEVNDTSFEATYRVIEDAGYVFAGWARGRNPPHFCGGKSTACALATTAFGGNQQLLAILASDDEFALEPTFTGQTPEQKVRLSGSFPSQFVDNNRANGFFITSLFADDEGWIVVMTDRSKLTRQTYLMDSEFPESDIMRNMNNGLNITALAYSGGTWVVVMSDSDHRDQRWISRSAYPASAINNALSNGELLTHIAYGDTGQWIVVFGKLDGYVAGDQRVDNATEYNSDFVSEQAGEGRRLSRLTLVLDQWITVMSGIKANTSQALRPRDTFEEINEQIIIFQDRRGLVSDLFRGNDGRYYLVITEYLDFMQGSKN